MLIRHCVRWFARAGNDELAEELIDKAGKDRLTLSFYQYAHIEDPKAFRDHLFVTWNSLDVLGRIYVANEGINGQLSLPADHFQEFKSHLDTIPFLKDIRLNIAREQDNKSLREFHFPLNTLVSQFVY